MNRHLIKKASYHLSRPLPLNMMRQLSGQNFIFPFYHLVSNSPSPCVKHLYPVSSEKQFRKDLDFLLSHFSPANFNEVLRFIENGKKGKKPMFFISFDDGFSECSNIIAPILKEKGIPAAFFINPAFVGNKQLSHRQKVSIFIEKALQSPSPALFKKVGNLLGLSISGVDDFVVMIKKMTIADSDKMDAMAVLLETDFAKILETYKPYMGISEIRQLHSNGFIIGSHSFGHPEFNILPEEEMKSEIERSFQFIETNLKMDYRVFSFPFSDIGVPPTIFNYLTTVVKVAASFGTSGIKRDEASRHLQRIPFETEGFSGAEAIIRSEYFYYLGKSLFRKNLVKRQ